MEQLEKIVEEISSKPNLSKRNIIDEIKNKLQEKDPNAYGEWRKDKFDMNHVFYGEAALLHLAAKYGIVEMVKALIENGANLNVADNFGEVPLCYAVQYGEVEVMRILIENNADVKALNEFGEGLLHLAAQGVPGCSKTAIVKLLIDNGADVDAISVLGKKTPLHSATTLNNNIDIVRALIENGASVNVLDFYENTPLHYAAQYGCLGIVKILIENGADVNRVNKYDRDAPLHLAAENNHLETVKYLVDKGADVHVQNIRRKVPIDYAKEKGCQEIIEYLTDKMAEIPNEKDKALSVYHDEYFDDDDFLDSYYAMQDKRLNKGKERKPLKEESKCSIQSYQKQQGKLFKFISRSIQNIEIRQVRQGLYLPSFEARNVKINGKCIAITRGLSQALLSQDGKSFLNNLRTSSEIYERIVQGKQISKRGEREVFAFSKLLDNFEWQRDSATNSLPSNLIRNGGYKTFDNLSRYIVGIKGDFAIHLVTSNHVVAIYRTGDNYAYFDCNTAFVSGLKSVDQLMDVVEKGIKSAGYKIEEKALLVEHFDVTKASSKLSNEDKQILAKEIKTERQLLAEQDKELGPIKINGQELSRVQLYDFGTKIHVKGSVPILINVDMKLSSKKFQDHLDKKEVSMTAREYISYLKDSKNVEEVIQATRLIPFEGSRREIEKAEQTRKLKGSSLEQLVKGTINSILAAVSLTSASQSESQLPGKIDNKPETYLNDPIVDKQLQRSPGH